MYAYCSSELLSQLEHGDYVQFSFALVLDSALSSSFSEVVSYIYKIVHSFISPYSLLEPYDCLRDLKKTAYIKVHALFCEVL